MSHLKGLGAEWRRELTNWFSKYNLRVYDPCKEEANGTLINQIKKSEWHKWDKLPQEIQESIITKDLNQINFNTNFIICYFTRYSTGTVSELTFAFYRKIPIYFVTNRRLIGWPGTIAKSEGNKIFNNFDQLKRFLTDSIISDKVATRS